MELSTGWGREEREAIAMLLQLLSLILEGLKRLWWGQLVLYWNAASDKLAACWDNLTGFCAVNFSPNQYLLSWFCFLGKGNQQILAQQLVSRRNLEATSCLLGCSFYCSFPCSYVICKVMDVHVYRSFCLSDSIPSATENAFLPTANCVHVLFVQE